MDEVFEYPAPLALSLETVVRGDSRSGILVLTLASIMAAVARKQEANHWAMLRLLPPPEDVGGYPDYLTIAYQA